MTIVVDWASQNKQSYIFFPPVVGPFITVATPVLSPRFQSIREREREDDSESGRGASLPQSPHSVDGAIGGPVSFLESEVRHLGVVSLSLCGGLADPDGITLDKFMKKVITFDDLAEQPNLLSNPDLVVKIRDG